MDLWKVSTRAYLHLRIVVQMMQTLNDVTFADTTMKCYGVYGCFSIVAPWQDTSRPVSNFPETPGKVDPRFCLHTRFNPTECQYIDYTNDTSVQSSNFLPHHTTYFVMHGFLESGDRPWMKVSPKKIIQRRYF